MKKAIFLLFILSYSFAGAQKTDFLKLRKYRVELLSDTLNENSGLALFKDKMYTFNDGGNTSEIFEIDRKSGRINETIQTNLENKDWEAIASDSLNLYVADFGNNAGTRKDLTLYKIPLAGTKISDSIRALPFYYPEQTDFSRRVINNDYDAEAMIFLNGKIHLFTKEWASKATTHYTLNPNSSALQAAQKTESYKTDYVVTDAAYYDKKLYLIGYTKTTEVFLTIFNETEPGIFFSGQPRKFYLGSSLKLSQIEGMEVDEAGIYISGEKFVTPIGKVKPSYYFIPHNKVKY